MAPKNNGGIVYSTQPGWKPGEQEPDPQAPARQDFRVWLEKNHRGGKTATVVRGYKGPASGLEELARQLKAKCGTGGSAKDGEIIIQGDHRDKIVALLAQMGHLAKKAGS